MGLGPAPEEVRLLEWGKPFGLLPSKFAPEDYQWLALAERLESIRYLNQMYEDPQGIKMLSKRSGIFISTMRRKAQKLAREMEIGGD